MPTPTLTYIQTTDKNLQSKDAVFDATVIANYGDPGLSEDYHADLLSRYVICKLESSNRTLTSDKYKNMIVVVRRPESLWINYQGGFQNNPPIQQRIDYDLNTNVGSAVNYSTNAIPAINYPYQLGERIKVKLIKDEGFSYLLNGDAFFNSQCNIWNANSSAIGYYQGWHNQGLNSNPYIVNNNGANALEVKTIFPANSDHTQYSINLNKMQYEAFLLTVFPDQASSLISLFNGNSNFTFYYNDNGGYAYHKNTSLQFNFVKFEDMNLGGKARIANTNCMPLIVAAPSSFLVPQSRAAGTVNYSPTYFTKA
jgi:hypothetical protein